MREFLKKSEESRSLHPLAALLPAIDLILREIFAQRRGLEPKSFSTQLFVELAGHCLRQNIRYISNDIFSEVFSSYLQAECAASASICEESLKAVKELLNTSGCSALLVSPNDKDFLFECFARVYLSFSEENCFYLLGFRGPFLAILERSVKFIFSANTSEMSDKDISFVDGDSLDLCINSMLEEVKEATHLNPRYIESRYLTELLVAQACPRDSFEPLELLSKLELWFNRKNECSIKTLEFQKSVKDSLSPVSILLKSGMIFKSENSRDVKIALSSEGRRLMSRIFLGRRLAGFNANNFSSYTADEQVQLLRYLSIEVLVSLVQNPAQLKPASVKYLLDRFIDEPRGKSLVSILAVFLGDRGSSFQAKAATEWLLEHKQESKVKSVMDDLVVVKPEITLHPSLLI